MSKSTASFIAYDLRPAKQIERRMLIDFVRCVSALGLDLTSYKYIGMGGIRFVDFLMVHRYLGVQSMVSMEQSEEIFPRCMLNKPLECIDLHRGEASSFIAASEFDFPSMVWLDYDWSLGRMVLDDISSLGIKVARSSFVFCTVSGSAPRFLNQKSSEERLAHYQDELGDFAIGYTPQDFSNAAFPRTVASILLSIFTNAFSSRRDGVFLPLFRVIYVDSMPMVTAGGIFLGEADIASATELVSKSLPPLTQLGPADFYSIDVLNLTELERGLFERAATSENVDHDLMQSITALGFTSNDIDAYRPLVRFAPRYVETYL